MKYLSFGLLFFPIVATAQFSVATVFSGNMVLQREKPIAVWGKAIPGNTVEVRLGRNRSTTVTKSDSSWIVYLPKQKANTESQTLYVSSADTAVLFSNILIGDVWICSGQSNMEWAMKKEMHWNEEKLKANQPMIRFMNPPPAGRYVYGVAYTDSLTRRLNEDSFYLWNGWELCDSSTVQTMSAVAYYFAKSIVANEHVPIGLINLSIGGAPAETFIRVDAMRNSKQFAEKVKGNWLSNDALPKWMRQRGSENVGNLSFVPADELGPNHAYKPGFAYTAGIEPLLQFPVRGVLWYQGETNAEEIERVNEYRSLIKLLIDDYRLQWKQADMPFYWVQLSSIERPLWHMFRDEQRKLLADVKNGGMAVCSDVGAKNDVHPTNKKAVGERLARWALYTTYGKKEIVPSGPLPVKAVYTNGQVIISFRYADGLQTKNNELLQGFSIDGEEVTEAFIQNKHVLVKTKQKPAYIYYGWQPFSKGNLLNAEQLPASTFKLKVE
ncbi:sialate O-acetylesterase [Lacibacter luteus]|uniref:Sialate O-acetylesterase n=1 Tax=Lacibacter luteus TaxID=2508719 RepID=A0A4Q1CDL7_9BACT|nr:sialate O-acetylesterase [Lacibacter luteus]RXK57753.1 sialate O-acetylesterase [Lacibacter luteus]